MGRTFTDTGEAIGTGAAMMVIGKNGEEVALGASAFISGLCGGATLGLAPSTPRPTIPNPTITLSTGGNAAVMTMAGAYAVPASNLAAGVLVGAATAASSNDFGGPMQTTKPILMSSGTGKPPARSVPMEDVKRILSQHSAMGGGRLSLAEVRRAFLNFLRGRKGRANMAHEMIKIDVLDLEVRDGRVLGRVRYSAGDLSYTYHFEVTYYSYRGLDRSSGKLVDKVGLRLSNPMRRKESTVRLHGYYDGSPEPPPPPEVPLDPSANPPATPFERGVDAAADFRRGVDQTIRGARKRPKL